MSASGAKERRGRRGETRRQDPSRSTHVKKRRRGTLCTFSERESLPYLQ
jgi:hypothetical protein